MNLIETQTKPDYNYVCAQLHNYILTDGKMSESTKLCLKVNASHHKQRKHLPIQVQPVKPEVFEPREKDALFWCLYIMKHGQTMYDLLEHRNYVVEKKLKIDYVEQIRKNKQLIKMHKFATLAHLESNLANDDKIDLTTFLTLCVIENLNVIVVRKRTYFELLMNDGVEMHTLHCLENHKHGYSQINADKESLLQIDNITKPLKSVSSYNVQELTEICEKLKICSLSDKTNKNKNKNELYESIVQYF
jgi:hypothetical protein